MSNMRLKIRGTLSVSEISDKFNECFPYLTIRFYKNFRDHKHNIPLPEDLLLDEVFHKFTAEEIEIMSTDRCKKVSEDFKDKYGVLAKLFRITSSGNLMELAEDERLTNITA